MSPSNTGAKRTPVLRRKLHIESLENREMLSVTLTDLPTPDYEPSATVLVSGQTANLQNTASIELAPPQSVRNAFDATPSTLTVYWSDPIGTAKQSVDDITYFEVVLRNATTKLTLQTKVTQDAQARSMKFEGLDPKTRYEITVTSCGEANTHSTKTLKFNATTANFPAITARAGNMTMSGGVLTITDKDREIPFANGKTTKTYTIEYVEKTTSKTIDWNSAQKIVIAPGTPVDDVSGGKVSTTISGLSPNKQYYYRVVTEYVEGSKTLKVEGRHSTLRTLNVPTVSISNVQYKIADDNLAINLNGRMNNSQKLGDAQVSHQLLVSVSTTTDRTTGKLNDSVVVDLASFGTFDSKGNFSLTQPFAFETLSSLLGASKLLQTKTVTFQILTTFDFTEDGGPENKASVYSRVSRLTLPNWYVA